MVKRAKKFLGIVEKTPMSFCTTNLDDKNERISPFKGTEKCHCLMRKTSDANIRKESKDMCLPASLTVGFLNIRKACQTFLF